MRWIACALLGFATLACSADHTKEALGFFGTPYGEAPKATRIDEQKGDALEEKLAIDSFKELTIGQGSGFDGFNAVRIFRDGTGYAVYSKNGERNEKARIKLSEQNLEGLIVALNADRVTQIKGLYSAGWDDGIQGFVEIKTTMGRRYCWLDNHFDPVSNTLAYLNKVILPKLAGAKTEGKGIDRQAEYHRIFHPKKQAEQIQASGVPAAHDP